uniref:Uncharacterized protein n=1 Tax=Thermococcus sp. CIR10 TaxID=1197731 RepID=L0B9N3_9EURY|nr:hypothetical protein c10-12 [Thermococcus sp. CIR10]
MWYPATSAGSTISTFVVRSQKDQDKISPELLQDLHITEPSPSSISAHIRTTVNCRF